MPTPRERFEELVRLRTERETLRTEVLELTGSACAYDRMEPSPFAVYSDDNPHVPALDAATDALFRNSLRINELAHAGGYGEIGR